MNIKIKKLRIHCPKEGKYIDAAMCEISKCPHYHGTVSGLMVKCNHRS